MKPVSHPVMRPQDIVIILKIHLLKETEWKQVPLARSLHLSQSEVSESIARSTYARLLWDNGKRVQKELFINFIEHGLPYAFPQRPGHVTRGFPTAHSAPPLSQEFTSEEKYVWPSAKGTTRGQSILPLYPKVVLAIQHDPALYELLALIDAVRVGKAREKNLAIQLLKKRLR